MNALRKTVLALLRSGLTDTPCTVEAPEDWEHVMKIAEYHGIISIIYRGIRVSRIDVPKEILTGFKAGFMNDIRTNRLQMSELNSLFTSFEENGIDYLPLKGIVMKPLYPSPEYRNMSDADIVIRDSQYDKISDVLKKAGFSFNKYINQVYIWNKPGLIIEFHTSTVCDKMKDSMDYFSNVFQNAIHDDNSSCYRMNDTDEMVYNTSHLAKHYITGGTRLRSLTDFYYLFKIHNKESEQLFSALDELKLRHFYEVVKRTVTNWFSDMPMDEECEMLLNNVFSESKSFYLSREFTFRVAAASQAGTETTGKGRRKALFRRILPPYQYMGTRYPVLKKLPFLLPFLYVWRWISTLLFHRDNMEAVLDIGMFNSSSVMDEYLNELKIMGLESTVLPEEL